MTKAISSEKLLEFMNDPIIEQYQYDMSRYLHYSTTRSNHQHPKQLEARIFADYHMIEKGLVLPEPRLGYGKNHIESLLGHIDEYLKQGYQDQNGVLSSALAVLAEYIQFHETRGFDVSEYALKVKEYDFVAVKETGGTITYTKEQMISYSQASFEEFCKNRYSIRNYSDEPISMELIEKAIELAQKTPSVCNRQTCKVYVVQDKKVQKQVLDCHVGNRGFGHLADKLLIVTSDLYAFEGEEERYQSYIDGGMFAMSLVYGLHYVGLGACTMNWCATKEQDHSLRSVAPIEPSENVILIVAVGHLPDEFSVAKSYRKPVKSVYTII